jgi:hypothetical protein
VITDLVVQGFLAGIGALLGLMPTVTFATAGSTASFQEFGAQMHYANQFAPVESLAVVGLALFVLRLAMQLWVLIVWIYHQFWGAS